jgi:hypothetical protein
VQLCAGEGIFSATGLPEFRIGEAGREFDGRVWQCRFVAEPELPCPERPSIGSTREWLLCFHGYKDPGFALARLAGTQEDVGFINPPIYSIGFSSSYGKDFHDIAIGTSIKMRHFPIYSAVAGFDLMNGRGSPNGTGLLNAPVAGK